MRYGKGRGAAAIVLEESDQGAGIREGCRGGRHAEHLVVTRGLLVDAHACDRQTHDGVEPPKGGDRKQQSRGPQIAVLVVGQFVQQHVAQRVVVHPLQRIARHPQSWTNESVQGRRSQMLADVDLRARRNTQVSCSFVQDPANARILDGFGTGMEPAKGDFARDGARQRDESTEDPDAHEPGRSPFPDRRGGQRNVR